MQLVNNTLFSPFVFESLDVQDQSINVAICRGTFDINDGELIPSASQQPVMMADKYRDQPLTSSVEIDTDLVPSKYHADITLNCVAHAPDGVPSESWDVSARIGKASKSLHVTGPRHWERGVLGWRLTRPEPTATVPIQYEYAFGGTSPQGDEELVFESNPVGIGFASPKVRRKSDRIAAPQIENPDEPVTHLDREYAPAGFGPIAKHWTPRRALCGTADENWKKTRWPLRPYDFDFNYYNSAPTGLVYPGFLRGDEVVELDGLSPSGPISFRLPGVSLTVFAVGSDSQITLESMNLDTLHIDTVAMVVSLTWRFTFLKTSELESIQFVTEPVAATSESKEQKIG